MTGALGAPWTVGGDFAACQSGPLPTPFAAGARADMCLVYLVPGGANLPVGVVTGLAGAPFLLWLIVTRTRVET